MPSPLLLAVDGNSLLHRAHHAMAQGGLRDAAGRPIWGLKGMISFVASAAARLTPDALVIGFDSPGASVRKEEYPLYKSHRALKPPDLIAQLEAAPALLAAAGIAVVVPAGYEADDVLASCAALARSEGWRTAVVTSDRDSFALMDPSTSVLRVLNGGMDASPLLTAERLPLLCGVSAEQYRDYAALRGDSSDNLPGAPGIGAKTAAKLLAVFAGVNDAYAALDSGREDEVVAAIGPAATDRLRDPLGRANVARNQRLMRMRSDLSVPSLASMRIPLDLARVQAALNARDIRLGPSLWALTGQPPPAWYGEREYDGVREYDGAPEAIVGMLASQPVRRVITLPKPLSRAGQRAAALAAAGQLSLF